MKKIILSLVAVLMGATATYAQSSLLATLTHEGTTTVYYGTTALSQAHEVAADGDVITLSSGTFTAVDITKAITLRGAGMAVDPTTKSEPTIIHGKLSLQLETGDNGLAIEGVYCDAETQVVSSLNGATFLKCRFEKITGGIVKNLNIIHCKVAGGLSLGSQGSDFTCQNSVVWDPSFYNGGITGDFSNCIVKTTSGYFNNCTLRNCIVLCDNRTLSSNTFFNCVGLNSDSWDIFGSSNTTNQVVSDYGMVFDTCDSRTYSDSETFELTAAAAQNYLGTDGKQVGIYGGNLPFDMRPSNPQITNAEVASKSDANGLLHINITVQGAE